jgi:hypothetical protein
VNPRLQLWLAQHQAFWRIRARWQQLKFQILSRIFTVKYSAAEEGTNLNILMQFFSVTAWQLFFAITVVIGLQTLELALINYLAPRWPIPKPDIYASWLATLAQISGIFIALYFTAVTAAASAIYAQVPNNVRDLLARERVGNAYIRYLTFATFVPLCLIVLQLLGYEPLRLAVPLLALIAGVGIIAFTKLGQRAFNLFDPTKLSYVLFADLSRWIRQVSPGGFRWLDQSFQKHAHRQAATIVDTLETVITVAGTQSNARGRAPLELLGAMLGFLGQYQSEKLKIPTGSLWFAQKYQQKDWYLTEDSSVQIAHQTGTVLTPETVAEHNWVEDDIERVALKFFETSVTVRRLDDHLDYFRWIERYIDALSGTGNVRRASSFIDSIQKIYSKSVTASVPALASAESIESIAIAETLAFLHIHCLNSYANALEKRNSQWTKDRLGEIRWTGPQTIYTLGLPFNEVRQLEWLLPRMLVERQVEGRTVTPPWYIRALVSKAQAEGLHENVQVLVETVENDLNTWAAQLTEKGAIWQSAAVMSRHLEYLSKLQTRCLRLFKVHFQGLEQERYLTDLKWPDITPQNWSKRVEQFHNTLAQAIAKHIPLLQNSVRPDGVPDYLGQFIHTLGEFLFDQLLAQQVDRILPVMPTYFLGSLNLFQLLKPSTPKLDIWTEQRLHLAAAPVLDLLELSGYAKLLAELYRKEEIWIAIRSSWDVFLENTPNALAWLAAITRFGEPSMQIPHRGMLRTNWEMRVQSELHKLARRREVYGGTGLSVHEIVEHESALVRYAGEYEFLRGKDIFVALYLSGQPGAEDIDWGPMPSRLNESLRKEEESYSENGHGEEATE